MTGKPTEPRIAAAALKLDCPRCGAMSGSRCAVLSKGVLIHVRMHKERTDLGHKAVRAENTTNLRKAFAS